MDGAIPTPKDEVTTVMAPLAYPFRWPRFLGWSRSTFTKQDMRRHILGESKRFSFTAMNDESIVRQRLVCQRHFLCLFTSALLVVGSRDACVRRALRHQISSSRGSDVIGSKWRTGRKQERH